MSYSTDANARTPSGPYRSCGMAQDDEMPRSHYVESDPMRCYGCGYIFSQRLQIGETPYCPHCASQDLVKHDS